MSAEGKIGVYLCAGCGIGEAVDVEGLEKVAASEFKVPVCRRHDHLCGDDGARTIAGDVAAGAVDQAVIAACSPRVMADRFRFDGARTFRANLREQVAWVHPAGDQDTQMLAEDQLRMAITQATRSSPPEPWKEGAFSDTLLVVGGGLAGLTAAQEASRTGYPVLLVERSPRLGGHARRWSRVTPHRPPYREPQPNRLEDLIQAVEAEPRITVMTGATVARTSGQPGRFEVEIAHGGDGGTHAATVGAIVVATGWRPYDAAKLGHLGYGTSPAVVTGVELEDRLGDGVTAKSVVFVLCAGSRDPDHLAYCSSVCCGVSIKQALQLIEADPETSVTIVYRELRTPGLAEEFYRTAQEKGVTFVRGTVKSVGAGPTVVVDDALLGEEVTLSGLDLVVLATGMVPNSTDIGQPAPELDEEKLLPLKSDIDPRVPFPVAGYSGEAPPAHEPPAETLPGGASILNLQYRQGPHLPVLADGFPDSHFICFPYETRRTGIHTCGPLRRPMDMAETAIDATGAVLKALQTIRNVPKGRAAHPRGGDLSYPKIVLGPCTKCRRCTVECPFGAIDESDDDWPVVNPTRCRRCGVCMGACPVRTISFDDYSVDMLTAMAKAVEIPDEFEEKPRILILACENDAYPALDMAGINRNTYSAFVRIIPVRCLGSVNMLCVSDAISAGYDGIILMGCKSGDDYQCHFVKGSALAEERTASIEETLKSMMLEAERVATVEVAIADSGKVGGMIDDFVATIDTIGLNPFKEL